MTDIIDYIGEIMEATNEVEPPPPYTLNAVVAELVGPEDAEEYRRLLGVWKDKGWTTQAQVLDLFDAKADFSAIEGVGERRAPLMAELLKLPGYLFLAVTGLQAE